VLLAGLNAPERVIELRRLAISRRGAGIGRAALEQVLSLVFSEHDARRVWLDVLPGNARARRLYESLGFLAETLLQAAYPSPDGALPLLVMSIQKAEWQTRAAPA
jgi:RimJ/RimL family protein N-acetyltransferase